jgi:hypothetical protein
MESNVDSEDSEDESFLRKTRHRKALSNVIISSESEEESEPDSEPAADQISAQLGEQPAVPEARKMTTKNAKAFQSHKTVVPKSVGPLLRSAWNLAYTSCCLS